MGEFTPICDTLAVALLPGSAGIRDRVSGCRSRKSTLEPPHELEQRCQPRRCRTFGFGKVVRHRPPGAAGTLVPFRGSHVRDSSVTRVIGQRRRFKEPETDFVFEGCSGP